jgi:hypothetical protein
MKRHLKSAKWANAPVEPNTMAAHTEPVLEIETLEAKEEVT